MCGGAPTPPSAPPSATGAGTHDTTGATNPQGASQTPTSASCAGGGTQVPGAEITEALKPLGGKYDYSALPIVSKLAAKYPGSARMQRALGKLELGEVDTRALAAPPSASANPHAQRAAGYLKQALALHDAGCELTDTETYEAMRLLAIAYVKSGDYPSSVATWKALIQRWPSFADSDFVFAEEQCENGDADGCAQTFQQALDVASAQKAPAFLGSNPDVGDMVALSRQGWRLGPIKKNGRYAIIIKVMEAKTRRSFSAPLGASGASAGDGDSSPSPPPAPNYSTACKDDCWQSNTSCESFCDACSSNCNGTPDQCTPAVCAACKSDCAAKNAACTAKCPQ